MGGECLTSITFTPQWGDVVVAQQMVTVMFDDVRVEIAEPARVAPTWVGELFTHCGGKVDPAAEVGADQMSSSTRQSCPSVRRTKKRMPCKRTLMDEGASFLFSRR